MHTLLIEFPMGPDFPGQVMTLKYASSDKVKSCRIRKEEESMKNTLIDVAAQGYSVEHQTKLKQGIL